MNKISETKMSSACPSERAAAIEESCDTKRFFAGAQNDAGAQTGRSMLEMLGVLAIIGVLSVGAIMGFRQAMNRHKANVILNDVSLAFEELATHETTGAISRYQVTAFTPESGHTLYAKRDANGNDSVEVTGVVQGVCEVLIQYDKTELYTQISDTGGAKLTACADDQAMVFGLTAGSSTDPDPEPEPTDPCDGKTCSGHGTCSDGVCTCSDGYTDPDCGTAPECNSSIACASPKTCSVDYHCECPSIGNPGVCQTTETQNGCPAIVNVTGKCGTNGICTNGACSECSSPMVANADGTACECPAKAANCKTQNDLTCACDVCEDGFEKNDAGECVKAAPSCDGGEIITLNNGDQFCRNIISAADYPPGLSWQEGKKWCEDRGLTMASIEDMCGITPTADARCENMDGHLGRKTLSSSECPPQCSNCLPYYFVDDPSTDTTLKRTVAKVYYGPLQTQIVGYVLCK